MEAGIAVVNVVEEKTAEGKYAGHAERVEEVVADKGYQSNQLMTELAGGVRSYIAERDRGSRKLDGRESES